MTATYPIEVFKEQALVGTQGEKEVAVITAQKSVEVGHQKKLAAEQKKFSAMEHKQEQTLRGEDDGACK